MRGMILPFYTTLVLMIIAVALILGGIVIYGVIVISGGSVDNRFDFVSLVERPYDVSVLLSESGISQRQILERSLQTSLSAKEEDDFVDVSYMLDRYGFDHWFFSILTDEGVAKKLSITPYVYEIDNLVVRCGADEDEDENPDGVCVSKSGIANENAGYCGVGRVEILAECGYGYTCCKEDADAYSALEKHWDIYRCGLESRGFCTSKIQYAVLGSASFSIPSCGNGRIYYEPGDDECIGTNDDFTPICCVPADLEIKQKLNIVSSSKIPLLYKGATLYEPKNYECHDAETDTCAGEFVRFHCEGPQNIQCCITDVIHCKSPYDDFICMDRNHCEDQGNTVVYGEGDEKLCPGENNYVCCSTTEPITGEPSTQQNFGECTLGGEAYGGKPFTGFVSLTIEGALVVK